MNKITIITINYNNKLGLEKTIKSVTDQSSQNFEYIIIDGGSTDGSIAVIKENSDKIHYWKSEQDKGVYNAMNKGIRVAAGDYLLFLNSGDWLYDSDTILNVEKLIDASADIYYGNAVFKFDKKDKIVKYDKRISFEFFVNSNFCHQATFIRKKLFDDIFYYNENFRIVSDWEFFIYAICIKKASYKYIDIIISNYDLKGISSQPEFESLKMKEREQVFNMYFSMFIEDYKAICELNSKRIQNVLYIKKYPFMWKIFKGIINVFMLFLPKEK